MPQILDYSEVKATCHFAYLLKLLKLKYVALFKEILTLNFIWDVAYLKNKG